jgi:hypothetical protein
MWDSIRGQRGIFPNNVYLSNYHFTHREKPIIQPYGHGVVLCTVENLPTAPVDVSSPSTHSSESISSKLFFERTEGQAPAEIY